MEDTRVALVAIIADSTARAQEINGILHDYSDFIIGRLGLPYKEKGVNIISIAIDAPQNIINSLAGRVGRLEGVKAKTLYS